MPPKKNLDFRSFEIDFDAIREVKSCLELHFFYRYFSSLQSFRRKLKSVRLLCRMCGETDFRPSQKMLLSNLKQVATLPYRSTLVLHT